MPDRKIVISQHEITTRHQILLRAFERMNQFGHPWMYILSENDADIVIYITSIPREMFSVYCYKNHEFWTSLSATRVAGMVRGDYFEIYYEDIKTARSIADEDLIEINGNKFWTPSPLAKKIIEMINLILDHINLESSISVHE